MQRWLYHYETVRGSIDELDRTLRQRVRDLLAYAVDADGAQVTPEGDLLVRLPAHMLGRDLHKSVRLHTGVAERRGSRTCIPLRWRAEPGGPLFPAFDGTIELEPQATTRAHLTIVGAASLPLGAVGGAVDATVLHAVADGTVAQITGRLAAALEQSTVDQAPDVVEPDAPTAALRVRDIMTPDPLVLHESMPIKTAALLLFHYDVAGAPVTNDAGGLSGVISEADLLDIVAPLRYGMGRDVEASRRRRAAARVGEACSRPAREVAVTAPVRDAAAMMRDHDVARLVVVDRSEVVGVVSRHDVLGALLRADADVQATVDRVLADCDDGDVLAAVEWGVVTLRGHLYARSSVGTLARDVRSIDGVAGVDTTHLTWDTDDLVPPPVPMI